VFSTASDSQPSVEVVVLQGERPLARDNRILGTFTLDGIAPAPRGLPQIEVTFDIDANGILNVSAKDRGTGKENRVTITGSTTLDKREVERMVKEAEANAEDDRKRAEAIETRNRAENLAYQAEKALTDAGDKVPADVRTEIETKVKAVRDAITAGENDAIKSAGDDLQSSIQKIGEAVYAQPGAAPDGTPPNGAAAPEEAATPPAGEDVVDAEFKEV
jgi:molecular chaperone DnaK